MTSPARWMRTRSPSRTSLRSNSSRLCSEGARDGHAPHLHRAQERDRGELARAAHLHTDALQARDLLAGRKLECERPPRMVGSAPEFGARRQRVQLQHHPVDLVVEVVAVPRELGVIGDGLLDVRDFAGAFREPEPPCAQGFGPTPHRCRMRPPRPRGSGRPPPRWQGCRRQRTPAAASE